jgi:hypothetical protein
MSCATRVQFPPLHPHTGLSFACSVLLRIGCPQQVSVCACTLRHPCRLSCVIVASRFAAEASVVVHISSPVLPGAAL